MIKSIFKNAVTGLILAIPLISEAASGRTPTQKLADSLLCNYVKSVQQGDLAQAQRKMMQGLILSETKLPLSSPDDYFYYTVIN